MLFIASLLGVIINFIFSIAQFFYFLNGKFDGYVWNVIDMNILSYGGFGLRLSGSCQDPNRGAFILSFYLFCILNFKDQYKSHFAKCCINFILIINVLTILITLSRTGYVCLFLVTFFYLRDKKNIIVLINIFLVISIIFFLGGVLSSGIEFDNFDIVKMFNERVSSDSNSSEIHKGLISIGFNLIFSSFKILFFGIGYGASYTVLNNIFDDNTKVNNFHSFYLSMVVESGIISLLFFAIIIIIAYKNSKQFKPLILMTLFFNVFYQLNAEPLFWFLLIISFFNINDNSIAIYSKTNLFLKRFYK